MAATVPVKILTLEDCELRIKNSLEVLQTSGLIEEDRLHQEANIQIWEQVKENILQGNTITFDINEQFGYWENPSRV
jgi:hypothetical protein